MKKILTLTAFLVITASAYAQETIKCETDEFRGTTLCKTESVTLSTSDSDVSRATLHLVYIFGIESYLFVPSFTSTEQQYSNTERVYFLIDGERENYKLETVDRNVTSRTVIEQYYIQLKEEDAIRFYKASEVRFKIDNDIYHLTPDARNKLRALVQRVSEMKEDA